MKKYRFYYHYYRQYNCMSVHFRRKCHRVKNVECKVDTETHWQDTAPTLIVRGWAENVEIDGDKAIIT